MVTVCRGPMIVAEAERRTRFGAALLAHVFNVLATVLVGKYPVRIGPLVFLHLSFERMRFFVGARGKHG